MEGEKKIIDKHKKTYTVYIHINKLNKKTYIGITSMNPKTRWGKNGYCYKNQIFGRAIEKYGWDNFEHIILFENKTKEEAEYLERLFIKVLLSNSNILGYNIDNGGNGVGRMSKQTRYKLSEYRKKIKGHLHHGSKKVYCDGKTFVSIKECADYYNIEYVRVAEWLRGVKGTPQKFIDLGLKYVNEKNKIIPVKSNTGSNNIMSKRVICDNVVFESISDCAKFYSVKTHNMGRWLRGERIMPEKFIKLGLKYYGKETKIKTKDYNKTQVICNNLIFDSIIDFVRYYGENHNNVYGWLLGNTPMPDKYVKLGLMYYDEDKLKNMKIKKPSRKKVICENIIYDTIKDCANFYDINPNRIGNWLRGRNNMPQEFFDKGLRYLDSDIVYKTQNYCRKVICDNKIFNSIQECCDFYNIKHSTLRSWLNGENKMPQKYIDLGLCYLKTDSADIQE